MNKTLKFDRGKKSLAYKFKSVPISLKQLAMDLKLHCG